MNNYFTHDMHTALIASATAIGVFLLSSFVMFIHSWHRSNVEQKKKQAVFFTQTIAYMRSLKAHVNSIKKLRDEPFVLNVKKANLLFQNIKSDIPDIYNDYKFLSFCSQKFIGASSEVVYDSFLMKRLSDVMLTGFNDNYIDTWNNTLNNNRKNEIVNFYTETVLSSVNMIDTAIDNVENFINEQKEAYQNYLKILDNENVEGKGNYYQPELISFILIFLSFVILIQFVRVGL